jgi:glucose/arabinose dehydrogenase
MVVMDAAPNAGLQRSKGTLVADHLFPAVAVPFSGRLDGASERRHGHSTVPSLAVMALVFATACGIPSATSVAAPDPVAATATVVSTAPASAQPTTTVPIVTPAATTPAAREAGSLSSTVGQTNLPPTDLGRVAFQLQQVTTGLQKPLALSHAPGDAMRQFVLEQDGRVLLIKAGTVAEHPFADLRSVVSTGRERGLLGLAFDPNFDVNGRVFVHYTGQRGETVIAQYRVDPANADRLDHESARIILSVDQPSPNHNGGPLVFGPDGFLYLGLGEGTAGGDPMNNGQNLNVLLGKVLRLDVSQGDGYQIPADNPFVGQAGRGEIWAYGLRNPWRVSFDRATGDMWIADVGESQVEEINLQPAGSRGGENYGWRIFEGTRVNDANQTIANHTPPAHEYTRQEGGCAVIGGYVYRGETVPSLVGTYLFGDYCSGQVWGLRRVGDAWERRDLMKTSFRISNFGQDVDGELYVIDYAGGLYKLVP